MTVVAAQPDTHRQTRTIFRVPVACWE